MSSPQQSNVSSSPTRSLRIDLAQPHPRRASTVSGASPYESIDRSPLTDQQQHPRRSPTLVRAIDPNDDLARERQRSLDADSAMQLSRARSGSVAVLQGNAVAAANAGLSGGPIVGSPPSGVVDSFVQSLPRHGVMPPQDSPSPKIDHDALDSFPFLPSQPGDFDDADNRHAELDSHLGLGMHVGTGMDNHLSQGHDPNLLASLGHQQSHMSNDRERLGGLPLYQASSGHSTFDFNTMEDYVAMEKRMLGITSPPRSTVPIPMQSGLSSRIPSTNATPKAATAIASDERSEPFSEARHPSVQVSELPVSEGAGPSTEDLPDSSPARLRQRKLSHSNGSRPRTRRQGGKLAMFEGSSGAPPPSLGIPGVNPLGRFSPMPSYEVGRSGLNDGRGGESSTSQLPPLYTPANTGHDRPYRFSFYSNALSMTIHARSLSELPSEGQSFSDLFTGKKAGPTGAEKPGMGEFASYKPTNPTVDDADMGAWWLDVMCPTDEEMKVLSKVFSIHPLTTEDIQMEETREKIELFRNYYLVCFRSFDQDPYSPTYLEPLNMYIIVFREGTLSFHFRPTPHPQNVRRRIKQLKDYINVTSDWISYALIDDITDAFGPLIQNIEYEVDSIDELVLILKEAEQSDMLRRIGTCRKKVMGLLRLMGNKADVVKGLAKRCNENWSIAPKSDIGLYLSDIQDHLITMTQNLNHYEKILSRSHSNYLAQISIEMTDANNQINDVLSKLTALGTVLIPMNLVTGLWGMNVHVPGEDDTSNYTWFISIIGGLVGFACIGGVLAYKLVRR